GSTAKPNDCIRPGDSTTPSGGTKTSGGTKPNDSTKPGNCVNPGDSTEPHEREAGALAWHDGGVPVGGHIDGDVVVDVYADYDNCTTIKLQGTPAFACSEAQLAAFEALTSDTSELPSTDRDAALAIRTCEQLADHSRPLLRQ